ncbi:MAG: methylated-DNA--[protein]-cysteine S-methyltransferase [Leptospirillia bacterium]
MSGSIPVIPLPAGLSWTYIISPLGPVGMAATPAGVCRVVLGAAPRWTETAFPDTEVSHVFPHAFPGGKAVTAYLNGLASDLSDVALDAPGTPFQQQVWTAARNIPSGETRSYGDIAKALGKPGAARAVGQALGANPVPLLVPCHRVVAENGGLGGFSAGIGFKKKLLALEQAMEVAQTRAATGGGAS